MRRRRVLAAIVVSLVVAAASANALVLAGGRDGALAGPVDCALVLGAGVRPDGTPSDVLQDRLDEALALYRDGRVARILVSGDHATRAYDEPTAMQAYLEAHGVPADAITLDHAGLDTYSSIWRAEHVFGARRVVVVTQRFHLARALWVARAIGLEAEGRAADRRAYAGAAWFETREIASRTKAVLDVALARTPRHVGPPIPLARSG